jgi:hypothetical protein
MSLQKAVQTAGSDLKHLENTISWQNCWKPVPPKKAGQLGRNTFPLRISWLGDTVPYKMVKSEGRLKWVKQCVQCTLYTLKTDSSGSTEGKLRNNFSMSNFKEVHTLISPRHTREQKMRAYFCYFGQRRHQRTRMGFFKVIYPSGN